MGAPNLVAEAPMPCPEPGCEGTLRRRPTRFGLFYGCDRWRHTRCRGGIGCHPNGAPLGVPAPGDVKAMRIRAHDAFDPLWKGAGAPMRRGQAYAWLANQLGASEIHIAQLDAVGCARVIEAVRARAAQGPGKEGET